MPASLPLHAVSLRHLLAVTQDLLGPLSVSDQGLPSEFEHALGGNGRFALTSHRWRTARCPAECRLVWIQGSNTEILNVLIYPDCPQHQATFATEIVVVNQAPRLFFIDLLSPDASTETKATISADTQKLRTRFNSLQYPEQAPEWATQYASQGYLYSRPEAPEALNEIVSAYQSYLVAWVLQAQRACSCMATKSMSWAETIDFKHLQMTESPGVNYLNKLFGVDWTKRFLTEFLHS